jgi:hypothetical protein
VGRCWLLLRLRCRTSHENDADTVRCQHPMFAAIWVDFDDTETVGRLKPLCTESVRTRTPLRIGPVGMDQGTRSASDFPNCRRAQSGAYRVGLVRQSTESHGEWSIFRRDAFQLQQATLTVIGYYMVGCRQNGRCRGKLKRCEARMYYSPCESASTCTIYRERD